MTKAWLGMVAGLACLLVAGVSTAEKPSEDYVKAMKTIGAEMQATNKAIAAPDYVAASLSAQKIVDAFEIVQKYWKGKADDAFKLADAASKSASDLAVAAGFNSAEGVAASQKQLTAACGACHMAHRERLPDGTYEIK